MTDEDKPEQPADPVRSSPQVADGDDTLGETQMLGSDTASRLGSGTSSDQAEGAQAWIGRRLGRYEIRGLLGSGGMGIVFRAFDSLIERDVAVKVLSEELSDNSVSLQRFLSEAKAAGKLSHPNTVPIYEVGHEGNLYYLVMEYVSGGSVADQMQRTGALSVLDATRVTADACRGLAAAHAVGLVHRDIKPANLLYAQDGTVKVTDFGLAKQTLEQTRNVTQAGKIVGTPYFMSPEQCESQPIDARSDLYSLGATYYCLLTGTSPYENAGSVVQVMYAHCNGEVLDPRKINARVPAAASQIIARAMAKRPEDRYQTAGEMQADLEAVASTLSGEGIFLPSQSGTFTSPAPTMRREPLGHERRTSRRWILGTLGAAIALLVLAAAVGAYFATKGEKPAGGALSTAANGPGDRAAVIPTPKGKPIQVGVLHSTSGTMAESESPVVEATLLAIEELNQAGGVLGRPVEALVRDGRSDPAVFATQATKLLADDKVCTVFGCWTSASRKTVEPIFRKYDNLLVYPVQYEGLEESPNVVYLGATPNQQIIPAVRWMFAFQGKRRFFLVGSDYVFPRAAGAIIRDTLAEMNAEVVGEEYLPLGSYDVKPIIEKIVAARPDVILNTINGSTNVAFFKELRAAGLTPEEVPTVSFSIGEQELRLMNVSEMVGDFAAWNYFQSIDSPENHKFVGRYHAKFGPQRVLTDPMEAAYVGVKLWAKAVEQAGSDDAKRIRETILGQQMTAPDGKVRIDPATRHTFKTPRIGRITDDGQFEEVWQAVKPEAPVPFPPSRSKQQWQALLDNLYADWGDRWSAPEQ